MGLENARVENDGQKLRGLENTGLENDGQTCGHSRFCAQCADAVALMPNGCPLCRIYLLTWLCVCFLMCIWRTIVRHFSN